MNRRKSHVPRISLAFALISLPVLMISCALGAKGLQRKTASSPKIHNLVPAFQEYWAAVRNAPETERLKEFKARIPSLWPGFYSYKLDQWRSWGTNADEEILNNLREYPSLQSKVLSLSDALPAQLQRAFGRVSSEFTDFKGDFDIYLVHSLLECDGCTRNIDGKLVLIFGLESMAKYHRRFDEPSKAPFFTHEMFHMYHRQFFPEDERLFTALWTEGLAVLTAKALNPEADLGTLSLDNPSGLIRLCDQKLSDLIDHLLPRLESTSPDDYTVFFTGRSTHPWIPKRSGYCLGFRVAEELAKETPLRTLAKKSASELLPAIRSTLVRMRAGS